MFIIRYSVNITEQRSKQIGESSLDAPVPGSCTCDSGETLNNDDFSRSPVILYNFDSIIANSRTPKEFSEKIKVLTLTQKYNLLTSSKSNKKEKYSPLSTLMAVIVVFV